MWSAENNQVNKVSLSEPPDNSIFDSLAQKSTRELDKEKTPTEREISTRKKVPPAMNIGT